MKIKLSLPRHWGAQPTISPFIERDGSFRGHELFVDSERSEADAWVVFDEVNPDDNICMVPPNRTFFVTAESVWAEDHWLSHQRSEFLRQFAQVRSSHISSHPHFRATPPFLPWMVHGNHGSTWTPNSLDLQALRVAQPPEKRFALSVICSSKARHPGHNVRLDFVRRLKDHFGESLHWFGNGVNPIETKWEGLAPYMATIAIENHIRPDLYTEKLLDPFLTWTIPIYAGATNAKDYFDIPDEWLIDMRDFNKSVEGIERLLESGTDRSGKAALEANRSKVLGEAHFLARVVSMVGEVADGLAPKLLSFSGFSQKKIRRSPGDRALDALRALIS